MTYFKTAKSAVCIAALLSATTANADVSAEQVWEDMKSSLNIYGAEGVTIGAEEVGDGTVTVSDIVLSMDDGEQTVTANLGTITFTEQGDGTVRIDMPESYPINMTFDTDDTMTIEVTQRNMNIIVSGEEADMTYDLSADRYAFSVVEIIEFGEPLFDGDILLAANNLTGQYNIKTAELRDITYDIAVGSLDLLADIKEPDGEGTVLISGKLDAMTAVAKMALPLEVNFETPEEMFSSGFDMDAGYGFGSASYIFDVNADGSTAVGSVSMGAGDVAVAMNGEELSYDVGVDALAVNVQSSDLPVPTIDLGLDRYGIGFQMPLGITEEPADFALSFNLANLTINDEVWNLADPAAVLPRDPASVNLDLTGQGKWFFDIMDPEQAAAMDQAEVPGELNALTLNDLLVSAGGAIVTGAGAFTFDNSDLDSFDGLPRPLGDVTLNIKGANGLIDNLVGMGLLPEDQASMGRMMMGMFARAVGDDELETTVEVNPEGHLIVNGQRMR